MFFFKTLQQHVSALRCHLQAEGKDCIYIYIYYNAVKCTSSRLHLVINI